MSPGSSSAGPLTTDRPPAENFAEKLAPNGTCTVRQALTRPGRRGQQGGPRTACLLSLATAFPEGRLGDAANELEHAAWWCGRLWGRRQGRAVVALGHAGYYRPGSGSYTFERFEQRSYVWPAQGEQLLAEALEASPDADVYVSVLLHRDGTDGRQKATAAAGACAWVDVDGDWSHERQAALDALDVRAWHVQSGARGGRHVYVPLDEDVEPDRLEQVNRRLALALGGDHGWERTKVLRLPGTLNHKPRPLGKRSVPVRWLP